VMKPGAEFIQFTYSLFSPLPRREFGLIGEPRATIFGNLPPARVWAFHRAAGNGAAPNGAGGPHHTAGRSSARTQIRSSGGGPTAVADSRQCTWPRWWVW